MAVACAQLAEQLSHGPLWVGMLEDISPIDKPGGPDVHGTPYLRESFLEADSWCSASE